MTQLRPGVKEITFVEAESEKMENQRESHNYSSIEPSKIEFRDLSDLFKSKELYKLKIIFSTDDYG